MSQSSLRRKKWESWEDDILRAHYATPDAWTFGRLLPDRSAIAIGARAQKLGLTRTFKWWTGAENKRFKKLHEAGVTHAELAKVFGVSKTAVMGHVNKLGIGRPIRVNEHAENHLVAAVRAECVRRGVKFMALKRDIGARGQFGAGSRKTSLKNVVRAVEYLGGTLTIKWHED